MQIYSNPSHFANQMLGPQHCEVLPFFHAFTGCDLVSSMLGIGKKIAWNAWNAYHKVTNTFVAIIQDPSSLTLDSLHMRLLEGWTVLMYSKNCDAELLNDAIKVMLTHSLKSLDSIPPTQHALFQHAKRAPLSGSSRSPKYPKSQSPVIGAGNGTPTPIWQMSATHVHCSSIVVVSWPAGAIVSAIELDSDAEHSANVKGAAQIMTIRQSEMANTSPCHIPVLGDVPTIKIETFDNFFVTSFLCSLQFLYF